MSLQSIPDQINGVVAAFSAQRYAEAIDRLTPLLEILPHEAALHNIAGAAHAASGSLAEALRRYDRAIALQPGFADAHSNRGLALRDQKRTGDALKSFDLAIRHRPDFADAHLNRGIVLKELGRGAEAIASYDRAILLQPQSPAAHYNRGNILQELRRLDEAVASFDRAIAQAPDHADAWCNRGNALLDLGRRDEAAASFDRAIALKPDFAAAYANRGIALHEIKRLDEALDDTRTAVALDPADLETIGRLLFLKAHMCDWSPEPGAIDITKLGTGDRPVTPFNLAVLDDHPGRNLRRSQAWARARYPARKRVAAKARARPERMRIGYFSADFHSHATMWLMGSLLEAHDPVRFEIHAFSFGPDWQDMMRQRVLDSVNAFHDVRSLDDAGVAELARQQRIDIAVDLKGYTQDSRPGIFAHGAAPIQMSYLGYPGSMGADFIDYIVADAVVIPPEARSGYSEKLIALPGSYQVNDRLRPIATDVPSRTELGLPEQGFVFCCFNNSFKITSGEFAIWMRLLGHVDGSVLWLLGENAWAIANLRTEAVRHGVDPDRLIFAARAGMADHLARHRHADLFLDTFACNAHTTASDALWAGVPVLTRLGDGFAARVAGSLLGAMDLSELVTTDDATYEALALDLARDPERIGALKRILAERRLTSPLFDSVDFARKLERGFDAAYTRFVRGQRPDHIEVSAA